MNETSLRVFRAICETGSFTKAASELFITQPAVSRHVQSLEHHYGVALFERRGRSVYLTTNGEILRDKTQELFSLHEEIEELFDDIIELRRGKVVLAASATVGTYLLPSAIADFCKQFPGVHVDMFSGNTHEVKKLVSEGGADIGFAGSAGVERKQLVMVQVHSEPLVLVTPVGSELSKRASVTPADMLDYNFVWRERGTQTRLYVRRLFKATQIPEPRIVVRRIATAKRFAQLPGHITALPYSVVQREIEDGRLAMLNVEGFDYRVKFGAFINAVRSPGTAALAFLQHLANRNDFSDSRSFMKLINV